MNRLNPTLIAAIGPRVRKSPYFDCTVRAGLAAVSTYNHMWLPMGYGDSEEEYRRLTERVSMWDVSAQRHIEVSGADADRLVAYATVVDTSRIERGTAGYAPMIDFDGQLVNDPILFHLDDGSWRFSIADGDVRLWLDALGRSKGFTCNVTELDTMALAIQGPNATRVTDALGLDLDDLADMAHRYATVAGVDVWVSRSGWSSQGGFEVFCEQPDQAARLWNAVADAGEPFGIGPGAPNAQERIENVLLSYGTDTGYDADPIEIGLEDVIDMDAGDFVGRDALRRIAQRPPSRKLRGLVIDGDALDVLPHPRPVSSGAEPVGQLRAAAWSPRWRRNLGLALLDAGVEVGADVVVELELEHPDERRSARVLELPFEFDASAPE